MAISLALFYKRHIRYVGIAFLLQVGETGTGSEGVLCYEFGNINMRNEMHMCIPAVKAA